MATNTDILWHRIRFIRTVCVTFSWLYGHFKTFLLPYTDFLWQKAYFIRTYRDNMALHICKIRILSYKLRLVRGQPLKPCNYVALLLYMSKPNYSVLIALLGMPNWHFDPNAKYPLAWDAVYAKISHFSFSTIKTSFHF